MASVRRVVPRRSATRRRSGRAVARVRCAPSCVRRTSTSGGTTASRTRNRSEGRPPPQWSPWKPPRGAAAGPRPRVRSGRANAAQAASSGARPSRDEPSGRRSGWGRGLSREAGKGRRERERVRRLGPRREYQVRLVNGDPQGGHDHIRMPFDDQVAPADRIEDAQPDEPLSKFLVGGDDEPTFGEASFVANAFAEGLQILDGEVMEEQIVS